MDGARLGRSGYAQYVPGTPRATAAKCTREELIVSLDDGRVLHVPLSWFDRLLNASPRQLKRIWVEEDTLRFPDADEVISVERLLSPPCEACLRKLWYDHGYEAGRSASSRQLSHPRASEARK
jgi:hypothetical protein